MKPNMRLTLVMLLAGACKPAAQNSGSQLQTLDNFAAGKRVKTNECAGNPAMENDPTLKGVLAEAEARVSDPNSDQARKKLNVAAVRQAFAAVPPSLQAQFLGMGGRILLAADANKLCTDETRNKAPYTKFTKEDLKALSESLNEVRSCYLFMIPAEIEAVLGIKSENPMYTIVIKNDPVEIKHGMVRVFGYMNAQLSGRLAVDGDFTSPSTKVALAKTPNEKFEKTKLKITKAFLDDLRGKSGYSSFEKFGKMSASSPEFIALTEFVYAEAFDSYFCNQHANDNRNTLAIMGKQFPNTLTAFTASLADKNPSFGLSEGLSLWGNPFTWASNKWNAYTQKRDAIIQNLTEATFEANGGKPPSFIQTVSIAANGAWRPVADAPLVGDVVKPAVKYTDAIAGATVDANSGQISTLTAEQRARLAASATTDVAVNIAAGELAKQAKVFGGNKAADLAGDAVFSPTGQRVMTEIAKQDTILGNAIINGTLRYGDQAATFVGGQVSRVVTDKTVEAAGGVVSDAIAGPQPGSAPAPAAPVSGMQ